MNTNKLSPATHQGLYAGVRTDFNQGVSTVLAASFKSLVGTPHLLAAETTLQKMIQLAYEAGVERGVLFADTRNGR